jgi:hypothetical protein
MSIRMRKFIGLFAILAFLGIYCLTAMAVGGIYVVGSGAWIELLFYVVAGAAWIPGAMAIIKWMSRPDSTPHSPG